MYINKAVVYSSLRRACEGRGDVEGLLNFLEEKGYYTSPCSGSHHLCCEGGLLEHSVNVYLTMQRMATALEYAVDESSIVICGLLHDLGKVGDFNQPNYIVNMIKDGRPTKANPEQKYKQSEASPYKTNPDIPYVDHEIRSVEYIRRFIELTPEEYQAILWHNGLYGTFRYNIPNKETPLYLLLHSADMWCSRVLETKDNNTIEEG